MDFFSHFAFLYIAYGLNIYFMVCLTVHPSMHLHFAYWCNKDCGMCNPVLGMVHIKEPLLLIGKCSLSLSAWSFTICSVPYNHK